MSKIIFVICAFFMLPLALRAQYTPADGSELNYRIVGFSFPARQGVAKYSIEIAAGNYTNADSFRKNLVSTVSATRNRVVAEVPAFGKEYTWRIAYSAAAKSELHHFSTAMMPEVDTDSVRLRILVPAAKNRDGYFFVDGNKVLYDIHGRPVWFLPLPEGRSARLARPRDLKYAPWGTVTFTINEQMYEMNYNGNILWKEPEANFRKKRGKERVQNMYHHQFDHLPIGHYMTLGMENVPWDLPEATDTGLKNFGGPRITLDSNGTAQQKIMTGRIIEFDQKHNAVWSLSAADYLKNSDLYYRRRPNGLFNIGNTHENAFFFDERTKSVYLSFRNLSRVVKFQYPGGKVLATFGNTYTPGDLEITNDFFCGQHCCMRSQEGYLYLYNNNTCNRLCGQLPGIVMIQEPKTPHDKMKKVWEYECSLDGMSKEDQLKLNFETGGSVYELADRSILCCMAGNYSKIFIVNRNKQILWSALPERFNKKENKWIPAPSYRASIITRKELESLIWNERIKK